MKRIAPFVVVFLLGAGAGYFVHRQTAAGRCPDAVDTDAEPEEPTLVSLEWLKSEMQRLGDGDRRPVESARIDGPLNWTHLARHIGAWYLARPDSRLEVDGWQFAVRKAKPTAPDSTWVELTSTLLELDPSVGHGPAALRIGLWARRTQP